MRLKTIILIFMMLSITVLASQSRGSVSERFHFVTENSDIQGQDIHEKDIEMSEDDISYFDIISIDAVFIPEVILFPDHIKLSSSLISLIWNPPKGNY